MSDKAINNILKQDTDTLLDSFEFCKDMLNHYEELSSLSSKDKESYLVWNKFYKDIRAEIIKRTGE